MDSEGRVAEDMSVDGETGREIVWLCWWYPAREHSVDEEGELSKNVTCTTHSLESIHRK